jgi:hypothetical protein
MRVGFLIIFIFLMFAVRPAFAEETEQSWDTLIQNGDASGLNTAVTQKDFDEAIKKIGAKNTKKRTTKELPKNKELINADFNTGLQEDFVLRIDNDTFYKDTILKSGFYKVNKSSDGTSDFIELVQGRNFVVKIKASKVKHSSFCQNNVKCIKSETIDGKYLKIYYKDLETALVGYLYLLNDVQSPK